MEIVGVVAVSQNNVDEKFQKTLFKLSTFEIFRKVMDKDQVEQMVDNVLREDTTTERRRKKEYRFKKPINKSGVVKKLLFQSAVLERLMSVINQTSI